MDKILEIYDKLNKTGVSFFHWNTDDTDAVTIEMNGKYGVFMDFTHIHTSAEELSIIAHEGGHIATGATHKVNSPYELVEQHENKADKWAIKKVIPREDFDRAIAEGHTELWDLADHFNVTSKFMRKACCLYIHGNLAVDWYC